MCLAIPGQLLDTRDHEGMRVGRVDFGGIQKTVCLDFVPEAQIDDHVLVHVGFAISVVDPEEARETLRLIQQMEGLAELEDTDEENRFESAEARR